MSHPLEGVMRYIAVSAVSTGAGTTYVDVRPSAGCVWEICHLQGYQDDGAVSQSWRWVDPDTSGYIQTITGAASAAWYFVGKDDDPATNIGIIAPVIVTYDRYIRFSFEASAADKTGRIRALVREFRGIPLEA